MNAATPVVCAIIERDGCVLVAQRPPGKRLAGFWEFPGGKIEPGESPEAALHRELLEELGCFVDVQAIGPVVDHSYDWGRISLHSFRCTLSATSPEPHAVEHTALAWHEPGYLTALDLAPADGPVLAWLIGA